MIDSLEVYNSLLGQASTLAHDKKEEMDLSKLNTAECVICCSEIVLGPHEAVVAMCIPPGEMPRHFECGHALHRDCYAVYLCSSKRGGACPICALERSPGLGGHDEVLDDEYEAHDDGRGEQHMGDPFALPEAQHLQEQQQSARSPSPPSFTELSVLDALALATSRRDADDANSDVESLDDAVREELELQAALRLSVRGEQGGEG
jgi:hypothetical protein